MERSRPTPWPASDLAGQDADRGLELSTIKAVEPEASRIPDVVSLAQGIPSFDTPEPIKRFVQERLSEDVCARYSVTPGLPRLRESIAETLRRDGMAYDADGEILVTAGSIEAIAASLLALVEPGDEVLVVSPTYASYIPAIRLAGAVPRFVPLAEDANFDLDPEAIEDAVGRRTRALILCNPNNPTGTVFSAEQTRRMLRIAEREDLIVIADEVYKDFLYGEARIRSAATEVWARHRLLRVCSFSKAYAMTGWRVGFVHGPSPLISEVLKVHDALATCAPVVSQHAALAALELGVHGRSVPRRARRADSRGGGIHPRRRRLAGRWARPPRRRRHLAGGARCGRRQPAAGPVGGGPCRPASRRRRRGHRRVSRRLSLLGRAGRRP